MRQAYLLPLGAAVGVIAGYMLPTDTAKPTGPVPCVIERPSHYAPTDGRLRAEIVAGRVQWAQ